MGYQVQTRSLAAVADAFRTELKSIRSGLNVNWYPYDILANVEHIQPIAPEWILSGLLGSLDGKRVLDIGAADGDLGFLFASKGAHVDFLDNPPTNFNDCKAVRLTAEAMRLPSKLIERDVDREFDLDGQYDLALCLGLLYHLRNPMLLLMELAHHADELLLSTRVSTHLPDGREVSDVSCAYFLRCRESNNDPTNYWNFTPTGLEAVLRRCGWIVHASKIVGTAKSNPVDSDRDARMFVYCERVSNWQDLYKHHDF